MIKVELVPPRAEDFGGSCCRQDRELKCVSRDSLSLPQVGHEVWQLSIGHSRVMPTGELLALGQELVKVTAPAGWVLTITKPLRLRCVEHALNPTS
jgi:hypothetical protein